MNFFSVTSENRNFGLDFIRAAAICLVLFSHRSLIVKLDASSEESNFLFGFFGVELFFVLSGFLIGKQLIDLSEKKSKFREYVRFLTRRWLRTLPLYYIVVVVYMYNSSNTSPLLHLLFLQNSCFLSKEELYFFEQSWSLTIEEFAYLIIPILFFFSNNLLHWSVKQKIFLVLISIIFLSIFSRYYYVKEIPDIDYDLWIRKSTFLRLDAICIGILMAWLKKYYAKIFVFLSKPFFPVFAIILILYLNYIGDILVSNSEVSSVFPSAIGFEIISLLLVCIIPCFEINSKIECLGKIKPLRLGISLIAVLSYCIYLIHMPIYLYIFKHYDGLIHFKAIAAITLLIFFISLTSYLFIEKPIKNIRISSK